MGAPQYEQAGADIGGTGTTNTIPRWTGASTLGDSGLIDDGTQVYTTARSRFGIGIATPDQGLHVLSPNNATTSGGQITQQNFNGVSNQKWMISVGGGDNAWVSGRGWFLRDMTAGATRIVCDTSGNVGIGTASPQEKLQIYGDLKVGVLASGSFVTLADETSTQKNVGIARLAGDTGLAVAGYGGIRFYASTTQVTSQVERMRISNAGTQAQSQVAIGTSSFTSGCSLTVTQSIDASQSGQGLKLPATPGNADTQTLDCYQENPLAATAGNGWTPTLSAAATWGGTQPNVTYARYVRMGSMVFCEVKLTMGAGTMTSTYGTTTIDSPFTTNTNASHTAVPVAAPGASGVGFQTGTTVYLPTIGASSTFILTWSFFA